MDGRGRSGLTRLGSGSPPRATRRRKRRRQKDRGRKAGGRSVRWKKLVAAGSCGRRESSALMVAVERRMSRPLASRFMVTHGKGMYGNTYTTAGPPSAVTVYVERLFLHQRDAALRGCEPGISIFTASRPSTTYPSRASESSSRSNGCECVFFYAERERERESARARVSTIGNKEQRFVEMVPLN